MSNRDPLYGKTNETETDVFDASFADEQRDSGDNATGKAKAKGQQAADKMSQKGDEAMAKGQQAADKAGEKAQEAKQKASEVGGKAQEHADRGMDQAASGMDQAASKLREHGDQQGGSVGSAAAKTADTLEGASSYLREKDTDQLMDDLESLIRRKPTESLLVAAGIGFVLSKLFR